MATEDHLRPQKMIQGHTRPQSMKSTFLRGLMNFNLTYRKHFCSLSQFLFPCTIFDQLGIFCSGFKHANNNNKTSFRTFERCSWSKIEMTRVYQTFAKFELDKMSRPVIKGTGHNGHIM